MRPSTCISLGMGGSIVVTGSIPWPAVRDWCAWRGLGLRETDVVATVLRRLDADHVKREDARVQRAAQDLK